MAIVRCRIRVREMMQLSAAAKGYIRCARIYIYICSAEFDRIRSIEQWIRLNEGGGEGNLTASCNCNSREDRNGIKRWGKKGLIFDRTRKRKEERPFNPNFDSNFRVTKIIR